jgi:hypothetical protein
MERFAWDMVLLPSLSLPESGHRRQRSSTICCRLQPLSRNSALVPNDLSKRVQHQGLGEACRGKVTEM